MWGNKSKKKAAKGSKTTDNCHLPPVIKLKPEHGSALPGAAAPASSHNRTSFFSPNSTRKVQNVSPTSEHTRANPNKTFFSNDNVKGISQRGGELFGPSLGPARPSVLQSFAFESSMYCLNAPCRPGSMHDSFGGFLCGRPSLPAVKGNTKDVVYVTKISQFRNDLDHVTSDSDFTQRYNDYWKEMDSSYASESGFFGRFQDEDDHEERTKHISLAESRSDGVVEPPSPEAAATAEETPLTEAAVMTDNSSFAPASPTRMDEEAAEPSTPVTAAEGAPDASGFSPAEEEEHEDVTEEVLPDSTTPVATADAQTEAEAEKDKNTSDTTTPKKDKEKEEDEKEEAEKKDSDAAGDHADVAPPATAADDIPTVRTTSLMQLPTLARAAPPSHIPTQPDAPTGDARSGRPTSMFMTAAQSPSQADGESATPVAAEKKSAAERNAHRPRQATRRPSRPLSRATSINAVDIPEAEELPDDLMSTGLEDSALLREKEEREREIEAGRAAMREARESERRAHEEAVQKAQQQLEQQQKERRAQREREAQARREQQAARDEERRRRREQEASQRTQSLEEQRRRFQEETRAEEERVAARLRAAAEERQRQLESGESAASTPNATRRRSPTTETRPMSRPSEENAKSGEDGAAAAAAAVSPTALSPETASLRSDSRQPSAPTTTTHKSPSSAGSAQEDRADGDNNFIQTVLLRDPAQLAEAPPAASSGAATGSGAKMTVRVLGRECAVTEVLPYALAASSTTSEGVWSSANSSALRGVQKALCTGYNAALLSAEAPGTTTCFRSAIWPAFLEILGAVLKANQLNGESQSAKMDITCALGYIVKDGVKDLFREDNAGVFEPVSVHASPIYGPRIKQLTYISVTRIDDFRATLDSAIQRAETNELTAHQTEGVLVAFVLLKQVLKKNDGLDVFLSSLVTASSGGDAFPFDCALSRMHNVYGAAFHLVLGGPCLTCFMLNASAPDSVMHKDAEATQATDALLELLGKLSVAKNYTMRSGSVKRFVKYLEKAQRQGEEALTNEKDESRRKKLQRYMDEQQRLLDGALKMLDELK